MLQFLSGLFLSLTATRLGGVRAGCWTAALFALSGYMIFYSPMVRPYPLAMLFATAGTWLTARLTQSSTPRSTWAHGVGLALVSTAGMYTIYPYAMVVIFHFGWWLFSRPLSKSNLLPLIASAILFVLLFAPWIPVLLGQLGGFATTPNLDFKGDDYPLSDAAKLPMYHTLLWILDRPFITHTYNGTLIVLLRMGAIGLGWIAAAVGIQVLKPRTRVALALSLALFFLTTLVLDRRHDIHVLTMPKMYFLLLPLLVMAWGFSMSRLQGVWLTGATTLVTVWLVANVIWILVAKPRYEDPFELNRFHRVLSHKTAPGEKGLYLFNNTMRRGIYTASHLAESIHPSSDAWLLEKQFADQITEVNLEGYSFVALMNLSQYPDRRQQYSFQQLLLLDQTIKEQGFSPAFEYSPSENEMTLYLRRR